MFLRAEYFDAAKAAHRLVKFMEGKHELFGKQALSRPLYVDDLDARDQVALEKGFLQVVPARDTAGRAVTFDTHWINRGEDVTTESLVRRIKSETQHARRVSWISSWQYSTVSLARFFVP